MLKIWIWGIFLDVMCYFYKVDSLFYLEYYCSLLFGVGRGLVKKLEDINNYIFRYILGCGKFILYNYLLNMVGEKRLEERRKF